MRHLHEQLFVAGQISAADIDTLKAEGFTAIINNRPDNEEPGQPSAESIEALAKAAGLKYIHLPMANGQPLPENVVGDFRALVTDSEEKVLAHCRSGMRSSVIWALGAIAAGEVTVDDAINKGAAAGIPLQNVRALLESVDVSAD